MIVKLRSGQEFVVNQKRGLEIQEAMQDKETLVRLGGGIVRSWDIASVMPGSNSEADLIKQNNPNKRLKNDNRSSEDQFKAARKASDIARKRLQKKGILKREQTTKVN